MSDSLPQQGENPGEWVERRCKDLEVSVADVARRARVSRTTIYRWKKGHHDPNWHSIRQVQSAIESIWQKKECG